MACHVQRSPKTILSATEAIGFAPDMASHVPTSPFSAIALARFVARIAVFKSRFVALESRSVEQVLR